MSIGRAIALLFAEEAAKVAVVDRDMEAAERTVAEIEARHPAHAIAILADVTKEADCMRAVSEATAKFGPLRILVNNVGVLGRRGPEATLLGMTEENWDYVMGVNLKSALFMTKCAVPLMEAHGAIVNISSIGAIRPGLHAVAYQASKAALDWVTLAQALAFGDRGIRANAIRPGEVWTDLIARQHPDEKSREHARTVRRQRSLLGTEGTALDIARTALFLASEEARWITGQILTVDGGSVLRGNEF